MIWKSSIMAGIWKKNCGQLRWKNQEKLLPTRHICIEWPYHTNILKILPHSVKQRLESERCSLASAAQQSSYQQICTQNKGFALHQKRMEAKWCFFVLRGLCITFLFPSLNCLCWLTDPIAWSNRKSWLHHEASFSLALFSPWVI